MRWILPHFLLLSSFSLTAEIRESIHLQDIIGEIVEDTLCVFDIDNTLIEPTTNIGSDQWYYHLVDSIAQDENLSREDASKKADRVWNETQYTITTKTVEQSTAAIFNSLACDSMALTARSPEIFAITNQQLVSHGISFDSRAPLTNDLILDAHEAEIRYSHGILLQGEGLDKGKTLVNFLENLHRRYKKIVFVDDKLSNVRNVNAALSQAGITKHVEFRYGATDERVARFIAEHRH